MGATPILFFMAFEVRLRADAGVARRFGDARHETRADAAGRFVLFTVLGSTPMLIGILFLVYQQARATSPFWRTTCQGAGGSRQVADIAAILCSGSGSSAPLAAAHLWLPSAHTIARSPPSLCSRPCSSSPAPTVSSSRTVPEASPP